MNFSIRASIARGLIVLGCLVFCNLATPDSSDAQISLNPLKCVRQAITDVQDIGREYCWDETYRYSPCDPFERGKAFRMHTGYWGRFYNCDNEEAKRNSPYIYWTCHRGPNLPPKLGIIRCLRCEIGKVKQRIQDGAGPCCGGCGEDGCTDCARQSTCSTCGQTNCAGCNQGPLRPSVSEGANNSCTQVTWCSETCDGETCGTSKCSSGICAHGIRPNRRCAGGNCPAGNCPNNDCASGSCPDGNCTNAARETGNCGKCRDCAQRRHARHFGANPRKRRGCATGDCAPEGFRWCSRTCDRRGNCCCLDTSIDDFAISGLIVNESSITFEPAYSSAPSQTQSTSGDECDCAKCKLKETRRQLADWNAQNTEPSAPWERTADGRSGLKLNRITAEDLRR